MKILLPLSSGAELAWSALAAATLHLLALGFGFSLLLERSPAPEIRPSVRCESISMLPVQEPFRRELVKKPERERVERKPVRDEAARKEPAEKQAFQRTRKPIASPKERLRRSTTRTSKESPSREKRTAPTRERAPQPEERVEKPPEPTGRTETAISRAASPAVEKGFSFTYPRFARLHGYEGRVELEVHVSPEGRVLGVEIRKSSGYAILDSSAVRQMKLVPFRSALSTGGRPIEARVLQAVTFKFNEGSVGTESIDGT